MHIRMTVCTSPFLCNIPPIISLRIVHKETTHKFCLPLPPLPLDRNHLVPLIMNNCGEQQHKHFVILQLPTLIRFIGHLVGLSLSGPLSQVLNHYTVYTPLRQYPVWQYHTPHMCPHSLSLAASDLGNLAKSLELETANVLCSVLFMSKLTNLKIV